MTEIDAIFARAHCIGVGGIGVSAIARLLHSKGLAVGGCDVAENDMTKQLTEDGLTIRSENNANHISSDHSAIIYSPAVPEDHPERVRAREKGVREISYPEAVGMLMSGIKGVAVSGTHGKTTTTALLGKMLERGGLDPTVIVGGQVPDWDHNLRVGSGELFLVEACEYRRSMLHIHPSVAVLTNIEPDHLDYYSDIEDIIDAFTAFVSNISDGGRLIYNADDQNVLTATQAYTGNKSSYSMKDTAADYYVVKEHSFTNGSRDITIIDKGSEVTVRTTMPGSYNTMNILSAYATARELGVSEKDVSEAITAFTGTWRRFEHVGLSDSTEIISDYAHHPTALKGVFGAIRVRFENKKTLAVFQPHQEDRTRKLFDQFVDALETKKHVAVAEIYSVAGRSEGGSISSKMLVDQVKENDPTSKIEFTGSVDETYQFVKDNLREYDVVVFIGAGDIDSVARRLAEGGK